MKRISPLPSLLTIGNFTCGFIAIVLCLQALRCQSRGRLMEDVLRQPTMAAEVRASMTDRAAWHRDRNSELLRWACLAIFFAMIFDVLDGRVARLAGVASRFGAELDSLADACSFGVAPAMIVITLWSQAQPEHANWWSLVMICGAAYAGCAILRLARYNVESGAVDKNYFSGLPTPGAAGAVVSAVMLCQEGYLDSLWEWLAIRVPRVKAAAEAQARALGIYLLIIGLLMVTRLRFVHIANRYLSGRRRFSTLVALIFCLVLLCERPAEVLFIAFNGYVLVSLGDNFRLRRSMGGKALPPAADFEKSDE